LKKTDPHTTLITRYPGLGRKTRS